jgi:hypothetical protein
VISCGYKLVETRVEAPPGGFLGYGPSVPRFLDEPCVTPDATSTTVNDKAPKQRDYAAEARAEVLRITYEAWRRRQEQMKKEDQPLSPSAQEGAQALRNTFAKYPTLCSGGVNASFGGGGRVAVRFDVRLRDAQSDVFAFGGQVAIINMAKKPESAAAPTSGSGATGGRLAITMASTGQGAPITGESFRFGGIVGITASPNGPEVTSVGVNVRAVRFVAVGAYVDPRVRGFYACSQ